MVMDNLSGQMEIFIKENFMKIWDKEKEQWSGEMEVSTKDSGNMDCPMAEVLDFQHSQACLEPEEKILVLVSLRITF